MYSTPILKVGTLVKMAVGGRYPGGVILLWAAIALAGAPGWLSGQNTSTVEKMRRAGELVQAGKPEEAIPIYQELTAAFPNEPAFGVDLAITQYKAGRYQDAIGQCNALLKRQPDLFPAWLFLGASRFELGEAAGAVEALRKALTLQPGDRNARVMLADALLDQEQFAAAAAEFEKAAQTMPDQPRILYGLGRSYEALAKDAFLRLEKAAPGSAEWLALGGDFELDRGQFARAFQRYRQALVLRPSFPGLHAAAALIYEKTGHPDWTATERAKEAPAGADCRSQPPACEFAAGRLRELAAANAATPEALYWRSKAYRSLSQAAYARLQELPPSPEEYEVEAASDEMGGRYPEAAAAWKQALQLSPGNLRIQHRLALALCRANDCASALPLIQDLLAREPSSAALNFLCGTALNETQQPGRALKYLETAVKLDGSLLAARAALGEAYTEAGKADLAIPQLEAAIADDPDGTRHYQLARAYQAAGKRERAAEVLRDYKEIRSRLQEEELQITAPAN